MGDMTKTTSRRGLIALNVLFLGIFAAVSLVPETVVQTSHAGHYIAVSSEVNGISSGVIYIMDTARQELVAVTWDHNNNRVAVLGYRNVATDVANASRN